MCVGFALGTYPLNCNVRAPELYHQLDVLNQYVASNNFVPCVLTIPFVSSHLRDWNMGLGRYTPETWYSPASLYSSLPPGTVILMMRTVALWDFDRRVIIVMLVLAAIMLVRALLYVADRAKVNVALFSQVPTLSVMYIYVRSLTTNCAHPYHLHPIMRRS